MANLTITVDDIVLKRARARALAQGTSVNAVLRIQLEAYAGEGNASGAIAELLRIAKRARAGSGDRGRTWTRDELHER